MGNAFTAKEIDKKWTDFVSETFMAADCLGDPAIKNQLVRLDDEGILSVVREERRTEVDNLIEHLYGCSPESRSTCIRETDPIVSALALERVLLGSMLLARAFESNFQFSPENTPPLPELFRIILLQKFGH